MLAASWRALGLPVPGLDERVFGEHDLEAARLGALHRQAGFDDEDALEVTRVLGQGMARYAEATRALVARTFMEPGLDEHELAHRYAAVAEQLLPLAGPWLQHVYATASAAGPAQRRGDAGAAARAGSTATRRRRSSRSPTWSASRSWGRACRSRSSAASPGGCSTSPARRCDPPVRIVKLIGDAVMLVAPEPEAMLDVRAAARRGRRRRGRGVPAAARRHRLRSGRAPLGRLVRHAGQPRQPADHARAPVDRAGRRRRSATRWPATATRSRTPGARS